MIDVIVIYLIETILFTITSFFVGLSGALVPGPMLTLTMTNSIEKGHIAGPLISLGHIIAEIILIILIFAGLSWIIGSETATFLIGTLGGLVLIYMGIVIYRTKPDVYTYENKENNKYGPLLSGLISSISNPYFFIWWATIGCAFMFKGLAIAGIMGFLGFLTGHWAADIGWYSLVSFLTSKGFRIMNNNHFKIIMMICGLFLIILGSYFIISAQITLISIVG